MKTYIYIDGFNFYYGCAKNTIHKWADYKALMQKVLGPNNTIEKIKLFSAMVKPTPKDPTIQERQNIYFRALKAHIPELEIYFGHFMEHVVNMPLANPDGRKKFADVVKREEKGSDVNLALHFLNDAWLDRYECGVIVSNDSDLAEALRLVRTQTNKKIGVVSPFPRIEAAQSFSENDQGGSHGRLSVAGYDTGNRDYEAERVGLIRRVFWRRSRRRSSATSAL